MIRRLAFLVLCLLVTPEERVDVAVLMGRMREAGVRGWVVRRLGPVIIGVRAGGRGYRSPLS